MSDTGAYTYEPINPKNESGLWIRVLIIEPGYWDAPISCILRPFEVRESQPDDRISSSESVFLQGDLKACKITGYAALSYTWGDPTVTKGILVNGKPLQVTANLESALRHLRRADNAFVLWVDAVCINQKDDVEEKNSQIMHMGAIYRSAIMVMLWLGDGDALSDMAFDVYRHQASMLQRSRDINIPIPPEILSPIKDALKHPQVMRALFETFDRPWFHRLWTVQEMVLAREFIFICGTKTLTEAEVDLCVGEESRSLGLPPILNWHRYKTWKSLNESGWGRLSVALQLYGGRLCQDPRDKIYGLLAISNLIFRNQIVVDYRYSIGQVYQMAATTFILEEGDLGSTFWGPRFYTSELASEDKEKRFLPSWVPDFSRYASDLEFEVLNGSNYGIDLDRYFGSSGGGLAEDAIYNTFHKGNQSVLDLTGVVFSQVLTLGSRIDMGSENWQQIVRQWEPRNLLDSPNHRGKGSFDVYWRTLLSDCSYEGQNRRLSEADIDVLRPSFLAWRSFSIEDDLLDKGRKPRGGVHDAVPDSDATPFRNTFATQLEKRIVGRVFSQLKNGCFAMVPENSAEGDCIAMVHGSRLPIVIRQVNQELIAKIQAMSGEIGWQLIGTAYVHGIMDGELWEDVEKGIRVEETMCIV
ncbi:heterokaryon incompatibility protein-domain-containing protein [Bisporella sp. PMI_857]|nr:heterokaryon incompatibility protein-domain-containing protein [Bisporella sp. PMI_857]